LCRRLKISKLDFHKYVSAYLKKTKDET